MENVINVAFDNRKIAYVEGLTQWDKGYLLKVTGIEDLDGIVEVHFSLNETGGEAKRALATVENGTLTVEIANFILQSDEIVNYNAYAFIYPVEENKAKTVRKIVFAVEARPKPAEWVKPDEPDILVELIKQIDNKADKATTLSGYGIEDAYTKEEVDEMVKDTVAGYSKTEIDGFLNEKVDKVKGKGLSANDFTDTDKEKLNNLPTKEENDEVYATKTALDTTKTTLETKITGLIENMGDIDTALDSIIAIQNELTGGA